MAECFWEPFAESAFFPLKLIVRSSTKVLLKTGAVVEEGAVHWVIIGLIIHALCDISDVVAIRLITIVIELLKNGTITHEDKKVRHHRLV